MRIFIYARDRRVQELERHVGLKAHSAYLNCLTRSLERFACPDPADAELFFIPLNLITFQFADVGGPPKGAGSALDPLDVIGKLAYLDRGRHLLLSTGDFGQRSRSPYEFSGPGRAYPELYAWLDSRFHLLAFESTPDLDEGDIGLLPYVQSPNERPGRRRWSRDRDLLYCFAGALCYPQLPSEHIRGGRLLSIAGIGGDHFVGSTAEARTAYGWAGSDRNILRRSVFALCPAGFGRWTFRVAQAIYYGAIPVIISDTYVKPHSRQLSWDSFSLTIPEAQLEEVPRLLREISSAQIAALQAGVRAHRQQMVQPGALSLLHADLAELSARLAAGSAR